MSFVEDQGVLGRIRFVDGEDLTTEHERSVRGTLLLFCT